jgi:hypothetical protein
MRVPESKASAFFDLRDAAEASEEEMFAALLKACDIDYYSPGNPPWPITDITYDSYDSSFEFKDVRPDWTISDEQWGRCNALGFARCWVCYTDGSERYYPGGYYKAAPSRSTT